ncbi:phospholipid-binding lipoprotein MlaA [Rhizomicrobium palustre]|uniref:Phospholipid-binding lipoprotein MlaA n=1 Tax=Rhizomicrobium palustre TaxID=189966 RepID=A0A846MZZ7_9PROT|nr:VacJ family lipoprotein [Rhizomicrobium palustre]NIK88815.1 phospholipid-binding lipoprotein MlaA [Rhizomicrobium palustre]
MNARKFSRNSGHFLPSLAASLITLFLAGCAAGPTKEDPYEATNREVFAFNLAVDRLALKPTAERYVAVVPESARNGVHNFLDTLQQPIVFANDMLQGSPSRAGETASRFLINATLGLGGLVDAAGRIGISGHEEDFGQTLAVWGAGEGPYLMLPFLGPSNPRDVAGRLGDTALDPTMYIRIKRHILWSGVRMYGTILDARARNLEALEGIERDSLDYYATVRSLYRQHRASEIRNGMPDVTEPENY